MSQFHVVTLPHSSFSKVGDARRSNAAKGDGSLFSTASHVRREFSTLNERPVKDLKRFSKASFVVRVNKSILEIDRIAIWILASCTAELSSSRCFHVVLHPPNCSPNSWLNVSTSLKTRKLRILSQESGKPYSPRSKLHSIISMPFRLGICRNSLTKAARFSSAFSRC